MHRITIALGCALLLGCQVSIAQKRASCTGPQLGTWRLQSYTTEDLETGQKTDLFGLHPSGSITYGSDCRMSAILIKDSRKSPASLVPTDAEKIELYGSLIAYAGTYSIDADKVSHHIDASWNQAWTGTTQVRQFQIAGKTLTIRTLPAKNALTGRQSSSVLIWIRMD
jgi:Lipocalin-like domain